MAKKKGNKYIIDEENNVVKVELNRRNEDNVYCTIDLEDFDKVINFPYTWFATYRKDIENYYVKATVYNPETKIGDTLFLHQFLMNANGQVVDHINHNTLDNRKSNLRIIPDSNNSMNRKSRNKNNTSGYRNVTWSKSENKWIVRMQINKKREMLGKFDDVHEAGKFAEEMRKKYYKGYEGNN